YPPDVEQGRASRFGFFKGQSQPCATIVQGVGYHSPHTLEYGQDMTAEISPGRTVTCTSAVDGLTCTSADGVGSRGFHLTVDSFTVLCRLHRRRWRRCLRHEGITYWMASSNHRLIAAVAATRLSPLRHVVNKDG